MTVVVTGATGHLGSNLVRILLDRGDDIRVITAEPLDVQPPGLAGLNVERVHADIRDDDAIADAVIGADIVYHLAARISIVRHDEELVRSINVGGVHNIVEACIRRHVPRLVHVSSIHAFSPFAGKQAVNEELEASTDRRQAPYDRSKAQGEQIVLGAVSKGLDAVIINPTGMIGPHDYAPSIQGCLLRDVWRGRRTPVVRGGFNFADIRDVASSIATAALKGRTGQRYLLAGHWVQLADMVEIARAVAGMEGNATVLPTWLAHVGVPFATAWSRIMRQPPRFTASALGALSHYRLILDTLASDELGHAPRRLEETLTDTYHWARQNWDLTGRRSAETVRSFERTG